MKIGFTGTQEGATIDQARILWSYLRFAHPSEFHHGDCNGADEVAHYIAKSLGIRIVGHPPTNPKKRAFCDCDEWREPKPYLERNHDIVNEALAMVGMPKGRDEELRSGTWATIRYARKLGTPIEIIYP